MGTNYFVDSKPCESCGHSRTSLHIGKCSYGWSFSFQGYPEDDIMSYEHWLKEMENPNRVIRDEYGEVMSLADFKDMVEQKKGDKNHARIFKNLEPLTKEEQEYVDTYHNGYDRFLHRAEHHCWIDEQGNSFSGEYFR